MTTRLQPNPGFWKSSSKTDAAWLGSLRVVFWLWDLLKSRRSKTTRSEATLEGEDWLLPAQIRLRRICGPLRPLTGSLRTAKARTTCSFGGLIMIRFWSKLVYFWSFFGKSTKSGQDQPKCALHGHILEPGQNGQILIGLAKIWPGTLFLTGPGHFGHFLIKGQKMTKNGSFWLIFQQGSGLGHTWIFEAILTSKSGNAQERCFWGKRGKNGSKTTHR